MRPSGMHYFPLAWPFIVAFFVLFLIVFAMVELGILKYAYERMGIPSRYVLGILLFSLFGSAINIPVAELPPEQVISGRLIEFYGVRYVVPVVHEWPQTILAVNVGGALIPVILSAYLLIKNKLYVRGFLAIAVVTVVAHLMARPVPGVGISLPIFIPPIVAALAAMTIGWAQAAPLAYIAGSLGTLIGADLLNLDKIQGLGAPVASIGGAGTFDGVFLAGIVAVLLSPVARPRRSDPALTFKRPSAD
jgi:uncharacterized membrane protein